MGNGALTGRGLSDTSPLVGEGDARSASGGGPMWPPPPPPPPVGGGCRGARWGGGGPDVGRSGRPTTTPLPSPPPQGGRERARCAAALAIDRMRGSGKHCCCSWSPERLRHLPRTAAARQGPHVLDTCC